MIDCDVHPQIGEPEELLAYVEPAQREWFRAQGPSFGLPGYSWAHPVGWFRTDAEAAVVVNNKIQPGASETPKVGNG